MEQRLAQIILGASTYLGILVPLLFIPWFYGPFQSAKVLALLIASLLALPVIVFVTIKSKEVRKQLTHPLIISLASILAIWTLSALVSQDPWNSFFGNLLRMDGLFFCYALTIWMIAVVLYTSMNPDNERNARRSFFVVAALVGIYAILEWLTLVPAFTDQYLPYTTATLGNPNYLATYLLIPLFWSLFFLKKTSSRVDLHLSLITAMVCFLALLTSGSRGGLLGLLFGLIVTWIAFLTRNVVVSRRVQAVGGGALMLLGVVFILATHQYPNILNHTLDLAGKTGSIRAQYWEYAIEGWLDAPILGIGHKNFYLVADHLYDPVLYNYQIEVWPDQVHNKLLEVLLATGILGFTFFFRFILQLFKYIWHKPWIAGALGAYFGQSIFSFDVPVIRISVFFFVAMIIMKKRSSLTDLPLRFSELTGGVIVSFVLMWILLVPLIGNLTMINRLNTGDVQAAIAAAHELATTPFLFDAGTTAEVAYRTLERFHEQVLIPDVRTLQERATSQFPLRAHYWYTYALSELSIAEALGEAISPAGYAAIDHVRTLSPGRVEPLVVEAGMRRHDGDLEQALSLLNEALVISPQDPEAHMQRGSLYLQIDEPVLAAEDLYAAIQAAPWIEALQNPDLVTWLIDVFTQLGRTQESQRLQEFLDSIPASAL